MELNINVFSITALWAGIVSIVGAIKGEYVIMMIFAFVMIGSVILTGLTEEEIPAKKEER